MKNVFVYARYSSSMQTKMSIKAQVRAVKKYCKKKGYKIIKIYADEAQSGTNDKRPEFQKMMKECQKKRHICRGCS